MIAYNKCNVGDISLKLNKFDQAWCEFVGVHEKYLVLIEHETEKESACVSYEEQRKRKLNLDAMVTEWRKYNCMMQPEVEALNLNIQRA